MLRPILKGIACQCDHMEKVSQVIYQPRSGMTRQKVPDDANREYLKAQNPAEGAEIGGLGATKVTVHAFPDPAGNEQHKFHVGLSQICIFGRQHLACTRHLCFLRVIGPPLNGLCEIWPCPSIQISPSRSNYTGLSLLSFSW